LFFYQLNDVVVRHVSTVSTTMSPGLYPGPGYYPGIYGIRTKNTHQRKQNIVAFWISHRQPSLNTSEVKLSSYSDTWKISNHCSTGSYNYKASIQYIHCQDAPAVQL